LKTKTIGSIVLVVIVTLLVTATGFDKISAAPATIFQPPQTTADIKRFGAGMASQGGNNIDQYCEQAKEFVSWYINWSYKNLNGGSGCPEMEFARIVGGYGQGATNPPIEDLQSLFGKLPGGIFAIGNEPGVDDGRTPSQYAQDYGRYYSALKAINPNFLVGTGGLIPTYSIHLAEGGTENGKTLSVKEYPFGVSGTTAPMGAGRISGQKYLEATRAAYLEIYGTEMPMDFINIHPYILLGPGTCTSCFEDSIRAWRQYMVTINMQNTPLIFTEFGVVNYFTPEKDIQEFMRRSFDFLLTARSAEYGNPQDSYRLVQRWAWFVLNDGEENFEGLWDNTALFDSDTKVIRPLGVIYRDYIESLKNRKHIYLPLIQRNN